MPVNGNAGPLTSPSPATDIAVRRCEPAPTAGSGRLTAASRGETRAVGESRRRPASACGPSDPTTPPVWWPSTTDSRPARSTGASSSSIRVLTAGEVERFTRVDQVDRLALVAEDGGRLVAVGRYDRNPGSQEAEVAFVVADDHQHRGIAPRLLAALAGAAGARGITSFVASVLVENSEMLQVFRHSGFALATSSEGGVVNVRLALTERHPPVDLGPSPAAGSEGEGAAEGLGPVGHVA